MNSIIFSTGGAFTASMGSWPQNYIRVESCGRVILEMNNEGELLWEGRKIECDKDLINCLKDVLRGILDEQVIREVLDS